MKKQSQNKNSQPTPKINQSRIKKIGRHKKRMKQKQIIYQRKKKCALRSFDCLNDFGEWIRHF